MKNRYSNELENLINKRVEYKKIKSIIYCNDADPTDNIHKIEVDMSTQILKVFKLNNNVVEVSLYMISKINIIHLKYLIKKYNFIAWSGLPKGDLIALDAPTKVISFSSDDEQYTVDFYSRIPKDGYFYLNKLIDYIYSLKKEKRILTSYINNH